VTRTTIDISAPVLRELKQRQRREGKTLGELASELLARALADEQDADEGPIQWQAQPMGEPRVDIEDKDAVWAVLDRP
jgi:hypothetical protein